ncbi:hypothetical protein Droror1_Dr00021029 [Drosera rotundifolia]
MDPAISDRVFTPCRRDKRSNSNSNPNRHCFPISLPSGGFKVVPFLALMETPQISDLDIDIEESPPVVDPDLRPHQGVCFATINH